MDKTVREYLKAAIATFDGDPATTEFQRGYRAALKAVLSDLEKTDATV